MGKRHVAERYFSSVRHGPLTVALLLLRLTAGTTVAYQGWSYLAGHSHPPFATVAALLACLSGLLLLVGLFTPIAGALAAAGSLAVAFAWLSPPNPNLLAAKVAAILVASIGAALGLLGPGGCSIDAILFGRREIIIPPSPRPPES